jgi:hypothetical protein
MPAAVESFFSVTAAVSVAGLDLTRARVVWEAQGQEPAFGTNFIFATTNSGAQWIEVEAQWPDGRRVFAVTNFFSTNGPPSVSVAAVDPLAVVGTTHYGSFLFTRAGDTSGPVMVNFGLGGTAVNWRDYRTTTDEPVSPFITIPAGAVSNVLTIVALTNSTGFNPETVVLTLSGSTEYSIVSPASATISLVNLMSQITGIQFAEPGGITIQWTSVPGFTYRVLYKSRLTDTDWTDLSGDIAAASDVTTWTDFLTTGVSQRFYRIYEGP